MTEFALLVTNGEQQQGLARLLGFAVGDADQFQFIVSAWQISLILLEFQNNFKDGLPDVRYLHNGKSWRKNPSLRENILAANEA